MPTNVARIFQFKEYPHPTLPGGDFAAIISSLDEKLGLHMLACQCSKSDDANEFMLVPT